MAQVRLRCLRKHKLKDSYVCKMCNERHYQIHFDWKASDSNEFTLIICRKCAIREEFGSSHNSKKYKRALEEGLI